MTEHQSAYLTGNGGDPPPALDQLLTQEQMDLLATLLQEVINHGHGLVKIVIVEGRIAKHPFKTEKSY